MKQLEKIDPLFDRSMRSWIANEARKNYWRVARWYELDDLVQDGYLAYAKCKAKYGHLFSNPPTHDERKWFMALVQTTYRNHIYDLAVAKTDSLVEELAAAGILSDGQENGWDTAVISNSPANDVAEAASVLLHAPGELLELVKKLISGDDEETKYRSSRLRKYTKIVVTYGKGGTAHVSRSIRVVKNRRGLRETTNQLYCRLLGIKSDCDIKSKIDELFA